MHIRPLEEADIPHAAAIVGRNYSAEYEETSAREFRDMFGTAAIRPSYVVAEQDAMIIGVAGFIQSWMDYNVYNIFWVNVDPSCQRQGIGTQLIERVLHDIRAQPDPRLILLTTDSPAYYRDRFGFAELHTFMDGTYQLMCLSLEQKAESA